MHYITDFFFELLTLTNEVSPYLLFGFLFAGILKVYFPKHLLIKYMGKSNALASLNASLLGVPMPLCSCGVLPTAVSLYRNGASRGSTTSFLISTPQTGIDSILVTYSMLGLPFTIIRPLVALITGFVGGVITNLSFSKSESVVRNLEDNEEPTPKTFRFMLKYAYVDFLQDISKWLIIGLLLATFIAVIVPDNFFTEYVTNDFAGMLMMLLVSVPMYVCATASVPIAAVLLMKGLSPGAILVFLMAGPATNAATITVLWRTIGRKSTLIYLATIVLGAVFFGLIVNFLPSAWFSHQHSMMQHDHSEMIPAWLGYLSSIILISLIINGYYRKYYNNKNLITMDASNFSMADNFITVKISGMTCNHCVSNVEKNLKKIDNVDHVVADLLNQTVKIRGNKVDLLEVKQTVEELGYGFETKL
jgi:uncharacterized membrane protein YraQ (UPF0718 family)/copper chaperone CopZ